jgi:hypothetical protein
VLFRVLAYWNVSKKAQAPFLNEEHPKALNAGTRRNTIEVQRTWSSGNLLNRCKAQIFARIGDWPFATVLLGTYRIFWQDRVHRFLHNPTNLFIFEPFCPPTREYRCHRTSTNHNKKRTNSRHADRQRQRRIENFFKINL